MLIIFVGDVTANVVDNFEDDVEDVVGDFEDDLDDMKMMLVATWQRGLGG